MCPFSFFMPEQRKEDRKICDFNAEIITTSLKERSLLYELQRISGKIERRTAKQSILVRIYLYFKYDTDQEFYPQFQENKQYLLTLMRTMPEVK